MRALVLAVALLAPGAALAQVVSPITSTQPPVPPGAGVMNDGGQGGQNIVPAYGQNDHTTAVSINPMLSDLTVGDRYSYGDGGGVCLGEQWGYGLGLPGIVEMVDVSPLYPDSGCGDIQTEMGYAYIWPDGGNANDIFVNARLDSTAQIFSSSEIALCTESPCVNTVSYIAGSGARILHDLGTTENLHADAGSLFLDGNLVNPGVWACNGTQEILLTNCSNQTVMSSNQFDIFLINGVQVGYVQDVGMTMSGTFIGSGWAYVDGGTDPLATQQQLRSFAIFTGATTTTTVGAALVQAVFSAPSAGVPARFAFHVNTAGLGAGNVTISLFDSTTSASKGSATFGCTATGDQNLAVTSPTAWAVNDAVEIRIDDSACTAANGPIGIPSASVKWQ